VNPYRSLAAILERGVSVSAATSRVLAAARPWAKSAGDRRTPILLLTPAGKKQLGVEEARISQMFGAIMRVMKTT
jgi:hypothetical protein